MPSWQKEAEYTDAEGYLLLLRQMHRRQLCFVGKQRSRLRLRRKGLLRRKKKEEKRSRDVAAACCSLRSHGGEAAAAGWRRLRLDSVAAVVEAGAGGSRRALPSSGDQKDGSASGDTFPLQKSLMLKRGIKEKGGTFTWMEQRERLKKRSSPRYVILR
ncbi:hypothetical protein BHM03_00060800 [Ensete ventricosum]|nr:hypothetical protein BHM03_00060800 [Ensete ventricosum]